MLNLALRLSADVYREQKNYSEKSISKNIEKIIQ